jgi:hypothetical protein
MNATQREKFEQESGSKALMAVRKLVFFIKRNSNLIHVNLANCGLDSDMLKEFGVALRRAKSLVSLHLSSNPGDTEEVREAICTRAHVKPY